MIPTIKTLKRMPEINSPKTTSEIWAMAMRQTCPQNHHSELCVKNDVKHTHTHTQNLDGKSIQILIKKTIKGPIFKAETAFLHEKSFKTLMLKSNINN